MTIKAQSRARPRLEEGREYIKREEHLLCIKEGCRNVIAVWALRRKDSPVCSRCRHE